MKSIKYIGIVGGGKMGTNLFNYLLDYEFKIRWVCSPTADLEKISKTFFKKISRSRDAGIISETTFEKLGSETLISSDTKILADCDLVIETITEEIELKRALFKTLDSVLNEGCIIASNSSSIDPGLLIPSSRRSSRFLGLHFFYPVNLKNIVEAIIPASFSIRAQPTITDFLDKINRKYIILDEGNSFILNKIFLDFQNEAFLIVQNGHITCNQLDAIIREYFFPLGVFEFIDCVGIDTMLASIKNYIKCYPHKDYYQPLVNHLEAMIKQGHLGQKSSQGFYHYSGKEIIRGDTDSGSLTRPKEEFVEHLRFTYLASVRRFTSQSGLSIQEINDAIKEYFGIDKGPFEF